MEILFYSFQPKTAPWYLVINLVRLAIFAPVYLLCNARATHERHLPVLFPHDWQYTLIHTIRMFLSDFIVSSSFLSMKK